MKPHKGTLNGWFEQPCGDEYGLGYLIRGRFMDHPDFAGQFGHTSYVVKRDSNEIETRNSRYTLGTPYVETRTSKEIEEARKRVGEAARSGSGKLRAGC